MCFSTKTRYKAKQMTQEPRHLHAQVSNQPWIWLVAEKSDFMDLPVSVASGFGSWCLGRRFRGHRELCHWLPRKSRGEENSTFLSTLPLQIQKVKNQPWPKPEIPCPYSVKKKRATKKYQTTVHVFLPKDRNEALHSISASVLPVGFPPGQPGAWTYCSKPYYKLYQHKTLYKCLGFDYCSCDVRLLASKAFSFPNCLTLFAGHIIFSLWLILPPRFETLHYLREWLTSPFMIVHKMKLNESPKQCTSRAKINVHCLLQYLPVKWRHLLRNFYLNRVFSLFVAFNCLLSALVSLQCCSDGNLLFLVQTHLENAGWATAVYCYVRSNPCQAVLYTHWINTMKQCFNWLLKRQGSGLKAVFKIRFNQLVLYNSER